MTVEVLIRNRRGNLCRVTFPSGNVKYGIFSQSKTLIRGMWEDAMKARDAYYLLCGYGVR